MPGLGPNMAPLRSDSTYRHADFRLGEILYMGTDAAWLRSLGVDDMYYYRFWGQVARWLAYQRNIAPREKVRLFSSPDPPARRWNPVKLSGHAGEVLECRIEASR